MDSQTQIPPDVRNFLEGLLKDAGMVIEDSLKEEMIKELYARLDNFMTTEIIDNLPAETVDEFIRLNEERKSKEEIEKFLKDKIPNSQEVFTNAFAKFRDLYLGNVTVSRNAPKSD